MATVSQIDGDLIVRGTGRFTSGLVMPSGTIVDDDLSASAAITCVKLRHQHQVYYAQADGTAVAVAIVPVHIVYGVAATVVAFEIMCLDSPSGGDLTFTVDLLKSNAGTPTPATILSAARTYPNATADATVLAGTIASPTLASGDTLVVQVAVSGSTGTQGEGLCVMVTLREDPV